MKVKEKVKKDRWILFVLEQWQKMILWESYPIKLVKNIQNLSYLIWRRKKRKEKKKKKKKKGKKKITVKNDDGFFKVNGKDVGE